MKLVVAISGASGVKLGVKFAQYLPEDIEAHVIVSENALAVESFERSGLIFHKNNNISAAVSSGSFGTDAVAVIPCSMNTLAKISCGIGDTLVTRVAAVAIKERKKLLLAPREMPLSAIALENMHRLASLGVIISPPVMGYYSGVETLEEMERFIIGRWYDQLGIENRLYRRWS